eukprot:PITA_29973
MASSGNIEIEKFNSHIFELWKLNMEDLLVDQHQWITVDPSTKPMGVSNEEWKKLDRKEKSAIRLCVSDLVFLNVSGEATAKALWNKLGTFYQSKSLVNKLFLWKKLYNLRMKDGDLVAEHLNAFNTVVSQLLTIDIKISTEDKCISLVCSLPDSWDSLVIAIGSNTTALQFDEIVSSLLMEDMRWKNMGYKIWNLVIRKVLYRQDVVFREVKDVIKHEVQPKEPEKIEFDLEEELSDSTTEEESEDKEPQTSGVRRSVRERRKLERYSPSAFCSNFSLYITDDDPRTVKEAINSKDGKLWKEAMVDEMASLHKIEAWDLVVLPIGRKPIGSKWVFKKKTNAEGKVEKYKARLVAKRYSQVLEIDFGDIFSPVNKVTYIRLLLSIVATFDFEVE